MPWPQAPQNLRPGGTEAPHAGQLCSKLAPHSSQKRTPSRFSNWHWAQRITQLSSRGHVLPGAPCGPRLV